MNNYGNEDDRNPKNHRIRRMCLSSDNTDSVEETRYKDDSPGIQRPADTTVNLH